MNWTVRRGERWAIVGPNGAGKTTLLAIAAPYLWPTTGGVDVLGERLERIDARDLRRRIGYVSASLADRIAERLTALEVVVSARDAALAPGGPRSARQTAIAPTGAWNGWAAGHWPAETSARCRAASASAFRSPARS